MITCRELAELLIDFVSDELPAEHRVRIEQHLKLCPPCVAYLESYKITIRMTRRLPCEPLPPELEKRLRAVLEELRREENRPLQGSPPEFPDCGESPGGSSNR